MYCGVETGGCAEHTTTSGDREDLGRQALILHSAHDCSLRRCGLTASSCMSTVYVVMEGGKTLPAAELQVNIAQPGVRIGGGELPRLSQGGGSAPTAASSCCDY